MAAKEPANDVYGASERGMRTRPGAGSDQTDARANDRAEHIETVARNPVEPGRAGAKPLLMVDIDGVISLFGFSDGRAPWVSRPGNLTQPAAPDGPTPDGPTPDGPAPDGSFHTIDGIPHFLSRTAAAHLLELAAEYELVWASGWEEKAEEYLPRLLGLPAGLPYLRFARTTGLRPARGIRSIDGHWKLDAIEAYAGSRALAWVDDAFNDACHAWAQARSSPTLLVQTSPEHGLTSRESQRLADWARSEVGDSTIHTPGTRHISVQSTVV